MNLKPILFFFFCFAFLASGYNTMAQGTDSANQKKDTVIKKRDTTKKNTRDTATLTNLTSKKRVVKDTLNVTNNPVKKEVAAVKENLIIPIPSSDTLITPGIIPKADSSIIINSKEITASGPILANTNKVTDRVLVENKFINTKDKGTYFLQEAKTFSGKEFTFYLLCILLFILALFKTFYPMYFNNLFRIFFNTSLRQNQLTDQLSQAKFPSFILNIFFTLSGGVYTWLLFKHFNRVQSINSQTLLIICILSLAAIYLTKFIILKFTGWLAGLQQTVDNYIFVIFLVNKIMGVLLIPFVILLAFSMQAWIPFIGVISALFIGLLFLSRYAKSYGALEKKLNINSFHLFIFVVGAEIIPLFIFYKIAVDYLV